MLLAFIATTIALQSFLPSLVMANYTERPRQLDLGARLMSTRPRPSSIKTDHFTSMRVPLRIPFSWERAPGIPKDNNNNGEIQLDDDHLIMPPKPPPGWRRSPDNDDTGNSDDNHYYCSDSDVFSDALDEISLSESFGVACRMSVDVRLDHRVPSFIMNRFLPAAIALAADSSPANVPKKYSKPRADHQLLQWETSGTRRRRPMYTTVPPPIRTSKSSNEADLHHQHQHSRLPSMVCRLMPVLPWNLKSTICGFKSPPVQSQTTTPRASVDAPPLTVRTKRCTTDHGYDDRVTSTKGMPFLDTSRLMRVSDMRSREAGKLRDLIGASRDTECVSERSSRVHTDQERRLSWSLPQINTPSEPWLSHAVNSGNRR